MMMIIFFLGGGAYYQNFTVCYTWQLFVQLVSQQNCNTSLW